MNPVIIIGNRDAAVAKATELGIGNSADHTIRIVTPSNWESDVRALWGIEDAFLYLVPGWSQLPSDVITAISNVHASSIIGGSHTYVE